MRLAAPVIILTAVVSLSACSSPEAPESVPETAATAADGAAPAEPGLGSPPEPGGGVPGSSNQNDGTVNPDGTAADPPFPRESPAP